MAWMLDGAILRAPPEAAMFGFWTVYGTLSGGREDTLEGAKRKFKETFEGSRERLSPFGHPQV
jgi:hypothetical protein